ncbi:MmgE/PrpD family protein [Variovorax sp.]|uniref:MmgE/PrpD family protein n=1 Tax=Variovorax sp. TaxID=1871043 RepID=UPI001385E3F8|nr:MmgE/PrpD family protein [Variovorax sp.]KAF1067575.1 MAG: hypothetical protein GAK39_04031 [Variovorax sp.]
MSSADAIEPLIQHVLRADAGNVPPAAMASARRSILDALGTTVAGAAQPGVGALRAALARTTGRAESRVAIHGERLGAMDAALVNIAMCHALEIDDAHYPAIVHPTAPSLWSALAVAESAGGVDGREPLLAVALATDVMCRLALGAPRTIDNGYHTALYSIFGGVVAAARLRRASERVLADAFGIALCRAAASVQAGSDGALVKRLQPAMSAAEGIRCVLFAEAGISGPRRVLQGRAGLYRLFNHDEGRIDRVLEGLGDDFLGTRLSIKRYPSSRCGHGPIEATLALVASHDIDPEQVEEVVVEVQPSCFARESHGYDPSRGDPQVSAQFSIDYGVAAALLWREVFIDQYSAEATRDPRLLALTRRVRVEAHRSEAGDTPYLPVTVAIRLRGRGWVRHTVRQLEGSPERPMHWNDVVEERWRRCAATHPHFARPEVQDRIVEAVDGLDRMADATRLMDLMTVPETDA